MNTKTPVLRLKHIPADWLLRFAGIVKKETQKRIDIPK